jgi:hypothetical protein
MDGAVGSNVKISKLEKCANEVHLSAETHSKSKVLARQIRRLSEKAGENGRHVPG